MKHRRLALAVAVVASLLALSGCYGPVSTTGVDLTVDCVASRAGQPSVDVGTQVVHVSLDAPQWSNPGATVPLANMTATGFDSTVQGALIAQVLVSLHGLSDFSTDVYAEPGTPPLWTVSDGFARLEYAGSVGAFGSVTSTVLAPRRGTATVDVSEIDFIFAIYVNGVPTEGLDACTPLPGQLTRVATIRVEGDHNYQ